MEFCLFKPSLNSREIRCDVVLINSVGIDSVALGKGRAPFFSKSVFS